MPTFTYTRDQQTAECADGTHFSLFDEHVRGEPRFYWTQVRPVGESSYRSVRGCEGSYRKTTAFAELKRFAVTWERDHPPTEEPPCASS